MKIAIKIVIHILTNALAILVAVYLIKGIHLEITLLNLLKAGLLLGVVNAFIRPFIKLVSFPFIILTFGLFTVIINTALLFLVSYLLPSFAIDNLWSALLGVIVISLVNYLVSIFTDN